MVRLADVALQLPAALHRAVPDGNGQGIAFDAVFVLRFPELGDQPFRFPCTDPRQESGKLIPARPEDQRFLWKDKAQQVGTASDIIVSGGMLSGSGAPYSIDARYSV